MSIPSGVALLAMLEGEAQRERKPKIKTPVPELEISNFEWENISLLLFGDFNHINMMKDVLSYCGYKLVRE